MIKKEENNAVVRQYDVETLSLELTRKKQEYNDIMSGVSTGTTKDTKVNMPLPARKADADEQWKITYEEIKYVKLVSVGSVNPNNPLSDNSREKQVELLNRCLNDYSKGIIIGKDTTIGRYVIGEHELSMEKVTYHIGFSRKPGWLEEDSGSIN